MNRSLSNWRRMVTEFFLRDFKLELSWFAVSWGRMANEFFLREINAHRCMMFNLSLGSASAMRRLRQEAGDLEEAPAADSRALDLLPRHDDFFIGANYMDHLPDVRAERALRGSQRFKRERWWCRRQDAGTL